MNKRVLFAEDDGAMRELVACALDRLGMIVETFPTVEDLLERVQSAGEVLPDVIVTDVVMPGMSGLDGLSILQHLAPRVPVVVLTAFGSPQIHERARDLGAVGVFDKPFNLDLFSQFLGQL